MGAEWAVLGLVLLAIPVGFGFLIGFFVGRNAGRSQVR